jgi:hypothetical protein
MTGAKFWQRCSVRDWGATFAAPRQAWAGATQMAPLPGDEHFMRIAIAEAARVRRSHRSRRRCAVDGLQFGQNHQRSDGARGNGGDPQLRRAPPPSSRARPSTPRANHAPCA